jgi:hypothetical protein
VLLLDFFSCLPGRDQQLWKRMLQAADGSMTDDTYAYKHPQLEGQLKLLYTAVTRCCNRLIFAETRRSEAGLGFFRWLGGRDREQGRALAEEFMVTSRMKHAASINDGDAAADGDNDDDFSAGLSTVLMTIDEWRIRGVDLALLAEDRLLDDSHNADLLTALTSANESTFQSAEMCLRKALQCFQRAGDVSMIARAAAQLLAWAFCRKIELFRKAPAATATATGGETGDDNERSGEHRPRGKLKPQEEVEAAAALVRCVRERLYPEALGLSAKVYFALRDSNYYKTDLHSGLVYLYTTCTKRVK